MTRLKMVSLKRFEVGYFQPCIVFGWGVQNGISDGGVTKRMVCKEIWPSRIWEGQYEEFERGSISLVAKPVGFKHV